MPNRYAWIALGIGAYLAFTLSTFPASAAYRWFAPPELRLSGIEGTVWSGRAALASAGRLPMQNLRWRVDALPLVTGRVTGRAQAGLAEGFIEADVAAGFDGTVVLRGVQMSTSLEALSQALPLGDVRGHLAVMLERAVLRDGWPAALVGQARIAGLAAPAFAPGARGGPIALGDYELTFEDAGGEGVLARFRDTGGPLEVAGSLTLDSQRSYRLDAEAAPRSDAPRELVQALDFMAGEPGPDGRRPFELTGSL